MYEFRPSDLLPRYNLIHRLRPRVQSRKEREKKKREIIETRRRKILLARLNKNQDEFRKRQRKFLCDLRFSNDLPDIPSEAKCLRYPVDLSSAVGYKFKDGMESRFLQRLRAENNLGVSLNLVDLASFKRPTKRNARLHPDDEALIDDSNESMKNLTESATATREWLQKPSYIDGDKFSDKSGKIATENRPRRDEESTDNVENEDALLKMPVDVVRESFAEMERPPSHPTNPKLKAVKQWPLIPNLRLMPSRYAFLKFDANPSTVPSRRSKQAISQKDAKAHRRRIRRACRRSALRIDAQTDSEDHIASFLIPKSLKRKRNEVEAYETLRNVLLSQDGEEQDRVLLEWDSNAPSGTPCTWFLATTSYVARKCRPYPPSRRKPEWHSVRYLPPDSAETERREKYIKQLESSYAEGEMERLFELENRQRLLLAQNEAANATGI
eukprot:g1734.t1